jgi:hypothetical protein
MRRVIVLVLKKLADYILKQEDLQKLPTEIIPRQLAGVVGAGVGAIGAGVKAIKAAKDARRAFRRHAEEGEPGKGFGDKSKYL